jgi:hypothetical protein
VQIRKELPVHKGTPEGLNNRDQAMEAVCSRQRARWWRFKLDRLVEQHAARLSRVPAQFHSVTAPEASPIPCAERRAAAGVVLTKAPKQKKRVRQENQNPDLIVTGNGGLKQHELVSIMRGPTTSGTSYGGGLIRYLPAVRDLSAVAIKKFGL